MAQAPVPQYAIGDTVTFILGSNNGRQFRVTFNSRVDGQGRVLYDLEAWILSSLQYEDIPETSLQLTARSSEGVTPPVDTRVTIPGEVNPGLFGWNVGPGRLILFDGQRKRIQAFLLETDGRRGVVYTDGDSSRADGTSDAAIAAWEARHTNLDGSPIKEPPAEPPPPPPPPTTPPTVAYIERGYRGSGDFVSFAVTPIALGETLDLVATINNDDGRRDNIEWVASHGTILLQEWDQVRWEAPNIAIAGVRVQLILDGNTSAAGTCTFNTVTTLPETPPGGPGFSLDDLLNLQLWEDILGNQEQVIQAVEQDLPFNLDSFREGVSQLFGATQDQLTQAAQSIPFDVNTFINYFGATLGANVSLGTIPIISSALGITADAVKGLQIPTPSVIWETFIDVASEPLKAVLEGGFTLLLEAIELAFVPILRPFLEEIQQIPDLHPAILQFIHELLNPSQQAVALVAQAFGSQAASGMASSFLGPLLGPVGYAINRLHPWQILQPSDLLNAHLRGIVGPDDYHLLMSYHGVLQEYADLLAEVSVPRLDANLINAQVLRGEMAQNPPAQTAALAQQYDQGISPEAGAAALKLLGYLPRAQEQILDQRHILPGVQDLVRFAVREAVAEDIIAAFGLDAEFDTSFAPLLPFTRGQGLPDEFARFYWRAHWELPSISQAFEMFYRSSFQPFFAGQEASGSIDGESYYTVISPDELDTLLRTQDVMPLWRERLKQISYNVVTRVDIRRMYRLGAVSAQDVELTYLSDGYRPQDAAALRQFVEREALNGSLGDRETEARQQFRNGLIGEETFRSLIEPVSFLGEVIDQSVETAQLDRAGTRTLQLVNAWVSALKKDLVDEPGFRSALNELKIPENEIDFRVELVGITKASDDPTLETVEARSIGAGTINRRYREGLIDEAQFEQEMSLLGYTQVETGRRLDLANLEFDTNLSLDLLSAFRAGLRTGRLTEDEFRAQLQDLGIRGELVESYLQYDQLRRALEEPTISEQEVRATGSGPIITRFQEGWTTEAEFREEMRSVGYTDPEIDRYATIADLRFDYDWKQDALTVLRSAFNRGRIDGDEFLSRLGTLGMDPNRAQTHLALEQLRLLDRDLEVTAQTPEPQLPP